MPCCRWLAGLILSSGLVGCSALPDRAPPSIAYGHIGQLLVASSGTRTAQPLIASARTVVLGLVAENDALRRAVQRRNARRARHIVFDMLVRIEPQASEAGPPQTGLKQRLETCLRHIELATDSAVDDPPLQAELAAIGARAADLVEQANTLHSLLLSASEVASISALTTASAGADRVLLGLLGGSYEYGLRELEADLKNAVQRENRIFSRIDPWYFRNFSRSAETLTWGYARPP